MDTVPREPIWIFNELAVLLCLTLFLYSCASAP